MQLAAKVKTRFHVSALAGLIMAGMLSACGGGGSEGSSGGPSGGGNKPVDPPVSSTTFERIGLDAQLSSKTPFNTSSGVFSATIDSSANITFTPGPAVEGEPTFNYNFTVPSGLAGGSVSGGLFHIIKGAAAKDIRLLTPSTTKAVQNIFWFDTNDNSLFGFGLAGYLNKLKSQTWPTSGTAQYIGKAFQYITDSNPDNPGATTYALFTSDVTATVDYSAKTIAIAVAGHPNLINTIGDPAVISADPNLFAADYQLTTLDLSGESAVQVLSGTMPTSGLGLTATDNALGFFGNNAEELGGVIHYNGAVEVPLGTIIRDQFISFALIKK